MKDILEYTRNETSLTLEQLRLKEVPKENMPRKIKITEEKRDDNRIFLYY